MNDETKEILLRVMEENWIHARQAEEKRFITANIIILAAVALQIVLVISGFTRKVLPLALSLAFLAIYGIATTSKLYERSQYHILRARKLRKRLDELCPDAQIQNLLSAAEEEHKKRYPRLINSRLNDIWLVLYAVIVLLGIVDTFIILLTRSVYPLQQ
jgi:hypothetical protein